MKKLALIAIVFVAASTMTFGAMAKGGGHSSGGHSHSSTHSSSHTSSSGSHSVSGYTKKDGTYVAPSHATNPDSSKANNWSQKGNVNPYTGKEGTKQE